MLNPDLLTMSVITSLLLFIFGIDCTLLSDVKGVSFHFTNVFINAFFKINFQVQKVTVAQKMSSDSSFFSPIANFHFIFTLAPKAWGNMGTSNSRVQQPCGFLSLICRVYLPGKQPL